MRKTRNDAASAAASIVLISTIVAPAQAEDFRVPAGRLDDVAIAIGEQSGRTIIVADRSLAREQSPGVRGNMSLQRAFERALKGTSARAKFREGGVIRLVRRAPPPIAHAMNASSPLPHTPPLEIMVTASKQDMHLDRFPGSVRVVDIQEDWAAAYNADGTAAITRLMPMLGSTNLGNGRNKLFIRGIADSSFTGSTPSVTGQYLGDVRLTYNAPDPDLNLYDMRRVEVLVGPQGTLYGAGSLGGVIRLVPNLPDLDEFRGSVATNVGTTNHGGTSADVAVMLNAPLARDKAAVRLVAFGARAAGYIDAPLQHRYDVNATHSHGQRLSIRLDDIAGWTLDLGAAVQNIRSDDGQYVLRGEPPFTRSTLLRQPFSTDYRVAYLSAGHSLGGKRLLWITSVARHHISSTFDASGFDGNPAPARYQEDRAITLLSNEMRLSGGSTEPWVAGLAFTLNLDRTGFALDRSLLVPGGIGGRNHQGEGALFGQYSHPLTSTLDATFGGRLTLSRTAIRFIGRGLNMDDVVRWQTRFSATAGLSWRLEDGVTAFYRFQQGHRPGGLGLGISGTSVRPRLFSADELQIHEVGFRRSRGQEGLSIEAALFVASWRNIQADQIEDFIAPSTTNIGHGRIGGLDLELSWKPATALEFNAAGFFNNSSLTANAGQAWIGGPTRLPNVARNGARLGVKWQTSLRDKILFLAEGAARYIGRSNLGIDDRLNIAQGDYVVADARLLLKMPEWTISLAIDNFANKRGNTFSYGNPFGLANKNQETPLRPRTIKIGLSARF